MIIKNLSQNDIEDIVILHKDILITPAAKFGREYLKKKYKVLIDNPKVHLTLGAFADRELIGVVTVTKDLRKTNKLLSKIISPKVAFLIIKSLILRKVSIVELISHKQLEHILVRKFEQPFPAILTLFVKEKYQRTGVARSLVNKITRQLKKEKFKYLYVDTLATNKSALKFYRVTGFKVKLKFADSILLKYPLR